MLPFRSHCPGCDWVRSNLLLMLVATKLALHCHSGLSDLDQNESNLEYPMCEPNEVHELPCYSRLYPECQTRSISPPLPAENLGFVLAPHLSREAHWGCVVSRAASPAEEKCAAHVPLHAALVPLRSSPLYGRSWERPRPPARRDPWPLALSGPRAYLPRSSAMKATGWIQSPTPSPLIG